MGRAPGERVRQFDRAFVAGSLKRQIEAIGLFLMPSIRSGRFEVRLYNFPQFGRVILADNCLFLTPYTSGRHGRHSPVLEFGRGELYDMFDRLFGAIWQASRPLLDDDQRDAGRQAAAQSPEASIP